MGLIVDCVFKIRKHRPKSERGHEVGKPSGRDLEIINDSGDSQGDISSRCKGIEMTNLRFGWFKFDP
jgi:hypothetical protein